jgi:hypothetical protein
MAGALVAVAAEVAKGNGTEKRYSRENMHFKRAYGNQRPYFH